MRQLRLACIYQQCSCQLKTCRHTASTAWADKQSTRFLLVSCSPRGLALSLCCMTLSMLLKQPEQQCYTGPVG